jgi:hypothetical protein
MNERRTLIFHFPMLGAGFGRVRVITDAEEIESVLSPEVVSAYRDHRGFPWLKHLAVGRPGKFCHVVFKRGAVKGFPCAEVVSLSNPNWFLRYRGVLGSYLLFRHGMVASRIESRFLPEKPFLSLEVGGYRNKMYRSATLQETDISNLYSEAVALNL